MKPMKPSIVIFTLTLLPLISRAQTNSLPTSVTNSSPYAPAVLPGKGLAQHSFLYTGEADSRNKEQTLFVVRDGKVVWSYAVPSYDPDGAMEELGDATMLSSGNIVFCRKVGASEVTPDKKIIWNLPAPKGSEIHSVQPIGLDRVLVTVNGHPPKLMLINTKTGATEKELTLPAARTNGSPHLQFRRMHPDGGRHIPRRSSLGQQDFRIRRGREGNLDLRHQRAMVGDAIEKWKHLDRGRSQPNCRGEPRRQHSLGFLADECAGLQIVHLSGSQPPC
jgi:hypothetical protein